MRIFTALAGLAVAVTAASAAADDQSPGWGMAIAARVIGEKCDGALKADQIAELNAFIHKDYANSVQSSSQGPAWWADLRDKLQRSYVEKYSDAANCTKTAREEAEDIAEKASDYMEHQVR